MNSSESSISKLEFKDGDDVLLTHLNGGRRVWAQESETFSRAVFFSDHIDFRQLDENGTDVSEVGHIKRDYVTPHYFSSLGDVAFKAAILTDNEWVWNRIGIPLPETVITFRDDNLVPLQTANDFSFSVQSGDGKDGEFRLPTIMNALSEGRFLIGADPGYFTHDMQDHAIGMASIDLFCTNALRSLAQLSLEQRKVSPAQSYDLSRSIAIELDYYSYYRFFAQKMTTTHADPLLTSIWKYVDLFDAKSLGHIKSIFKQNGYFISKNNKVVRSPESIAHYRQAKRVLDPNPN